ncbi:nicotinate-nucleotide--dimethylbenzimidazole phosphoribosyltransferase [Desulfitispora alkaliphila]|uniref:nicotinate-nucleotide--dimethylbenzimidazole phosphoribosyltransferase n=1 Tax=Desulfitispora alkaliphila TaxID=622674 RepID=UPI003D252338
MSLLRETVSKIGELDRDAMEKCKERLDSLTKPPGSLGVLEDLAIKLAGIREQVLNQVDKRSVLVMAGDHGVVAEGVSAFPQEVTPQMVLNFLNGGAAINVLSHHAGANVKVADIGVASDMNYPQLINKKVRRGTDNMAKGPAMTRDEAIKAIEAGIEIAEAEIKAGVNLLATGEMGIGNTTASSAILVGSGLELDVVVGRGTGLNDEGLERKRQAIKRAIEINQPDPQDGLDILHKVGGLEIGAIIGVILAAAANRIPVIIDGFIAGAAAVIAARIEPKSLDYIIPSHSSAEPGHARALNSLGLRPYLELDMRLGEGTGAVLAMHLVEASCKIVSEMATFADAGVSRA